MPRVSIFDKPTSVEPHSLDPKGEIRRYKFANGYEASVVRCKVSGVYASYTSNNQEWELAVCHKGIIVYDTPITNDVIGYLDKKAVCKILHKIKRLPKRS